MPAFIDLKDIKYVRGRFEDREQHPGLYSASRSPVHFGRTGIAVACSRVEISKDDRHRIGPSDRILIVNGLTGV